MMFNQQLFEKSIRDRLEKERLSIRGASKHIGIGASTLSRILSGENPNIMTFTRIIAWLDGSHVMFFQSGKTDDRYSLLHNALLDLHLDPNMAKAVTTIVEEIMQ